MDVILLKNERKELIIKQINIHTRVTFAELSTLTNVSEDTIRRDLNELAAEGKVVKVRGGAAVSALRASALPDEVYAKEAKQTIAKKALKLITPHSFNLIGGGTTVRELIKILPDSLHATFITVNPLTALDLMEKPNIETILIGGKISKYSQMVIGGNVINELSSIKADLCILGTNAIHAAEGIADSDWETVQVKKAMINAAQKTTILAISEKLNTTARFNVGKIADVHHLITELEPQNLLLRLYTEGGCCVL